MTQTHVNFKGFTLVEMAIVLVAIGLMLGGLLAPLSAQIDQRNYNETRQKMADINEALIGYGLSHGYLPCPTSSPSNGAEERVGNTCSNSNRAGFLPWAELGVPKLDSWGHLYRYSVDPDYANSSTKISLSTPGDIIIKTRDSAGNLINLTNSGTGSDPGKIPAVVVSFGKNGARAYSDDGVMVSDNSSTNIDEETNANGTTTFVSRDITNNTLAGGGEIDDIIVWLSPNVYINRMVSAGQLP